MKNLRIHHKLLIAFFIIATIGGVAALINMHSASRLKSGMQDMGRTLEKVQSIMTINDQMKSIMAREFRLLSTELNLQQRQVIYREIQDTLANLELEIQKFETFPHSAEEHKLLNSFKEKWHRWRAEGLDYLQLNIEMDKTDILNPLLFQNTLQQYKEKAYKWLLALNDSIANEAPFHEAMSPDKSDLGQWLFSLTSDNASLAVAIGKARRPLADLYFSAKKINTLIASDREQVFELLLEIFESETLPAQEELFSSLDLMSKEADQAAIIYSRMNQQSNKLSSFFCTVRDDMQRLVLNTRQESATITEQIQHQATLSTILSFSALVIGVFMVIILSTYLARFITQPIMRMNRGFKHFMDTNDFSTMVEIDSTDEIGQMSRSFNEMVHQLQYYYSEVQDKNQDLTETQQELQAANIMLEDHSHTLEQKVEERTIELTSQKEKMQQLNIKLVNINDQLATEVTKHRHTLDELQAAKEGAEGADRTKSTFLANMSHEIRTPMNAIIGLSSLALKQDISHKVRDYLSTVSSAARSLLGVIDDILDFSKIEAGHLEMEDINFSMQDMLNDLHAIFLPKAQEQGLTFNINCDESLPDGLIGDPLRLGQVLMNLLSNAMKFTHQGSITLTVQQRAELDEGKIELHFSVADSGIGLEKEQLAQLFDPFCQADESISRQYGGTGLGLSISKRIVEQFQGRIWVESQPEQGSTFHFTVQLTIQPQIKLPQKYNEEIFAGKRVLIVDDNKMFRYFMSKMFASFFFEVETAESGENALTILHNMASLKSLPHVILLDQAMPGMDGLTFVKRLKNTAFQDIPIIMISASGQEKTLRRQSEAAGIGTLLSKPVKRALLLSTLEQILLGADLSQENTLAIEEMNPTEGSLLGRRILLVEDNSINRQVALEILGSFGTEVVAAENGLEALNKVNTEFDAVLMDIQMPHMDGLEATRQMRCRPELRDLPIIAMTAKAMKGDKEICLAAGMNDYVAKPIEPEAIMAALNRWLKKRNGDSNAKPPKEHPDTSPEALSLQISGLDSTKALKRLSGNASLLKQLLVEFGRDNCTICQDIHSFVMADDREKAVRAAHTLKGVAGNLSAIQVQEAALGVESALRNGQSAEEELGVLENRLAEILADIKKLPYEETIGESQPMASVSLPSAEILTKELMQLDKLISSNTPRALKYLHSLPPYDNDSFQQASKEIAKQLDRFEFEQAGIILQRLLTELNINLETLH